MIRVWTRNGNDTEPALFGTAPSACCTCWRCADQPLRPVYRNKAKVHAYPLEGSWMRVTAVLDYALLFTFIDNTLLHQFLLAVVVASLPPHPGLVRRSKTRTFDPASVARHVHPADRYSSCLCATLTLRFRYALPHHEHSQVHGSGLAGVGRGADLADRHGCLRD